MRKDTFIKLQKKFGGNWVATDKTGAKVYAAAKGVDKLVEALHSKKIAPQKTVIGYIAKYGRIHIHVSLSVRKRRV